MHNKIKFRLNKYTINFVVVYSILLFLIKSILKIISYFIAFNMVKVGGCVLGSLLVMLLLAYKVITHSDEYKNMNFSEDVINSLTSHLKYLDKLNTYIGNEVDFIKKQGLYTFSCKNNNYLIQELYKDELPYIKEGNEFWISANALYLELMTNNPRHRELEKINSFISLEENLYKHREKVLKTLKNLFTDKNNCYEFKNKGKMNNYISENKIIIQKAIKLNDLIHSMDDYTPHKKMLTKLFDNWVILAVNYIVDTNDCLNKELMSAFNDISLMATKVIVEINTQKEQLKKEECEKIKKIWDKESEEYAKLVNSIAQDLNNLDNLK